MSSVNLNRQKKLNAQMNEVMDDFDRFEYAFASNWKKIVIAAVAVVVVVAIAVSVKVFIKSSEMKKAQAFAAAVTIEDLEKTVQKYGSAPADARLRLASLYMDKKDYANARKELAAAADDNAMELRWRAQLNIAYVDELEGKYADGAAKFADFAKSRREVGSAAFAAEAYAAAGRLYLLAGQIEEGKNILTAGRSFIQSLPAEERSVMQGYSGMINSLLANPAAVK